MDRQQPHDAVMELSMRYVRPVGSRGMMTFYYAPVGNAAMGPVAFPVPRSRVVQHGCLDPQLQDHGREHVRAFQTAGTRAVIAPSTEAAPPPRIITPRLSAIASR